MSPTILVLVVVLWMTVAFIVLRLAAIRYLGDARRGAVVAMAVVVAFTLGALLPFPHRSGDAGASARGTTGQVATQRRSYYLDSGGVDVSARCSSLKPGSDSVAGHVDLVGAVRGGFVEDRNDAPVFMSSDDVVLTGWATERDGGALADGVCLIVDGEISRDAVARYRYPRPDIALMFHNASVRDGGFQLRVAAKRLSIGKHQLRVVVFTQSGHVGEIAQPLKVTVH